MSGAETSRSFTTAGAGRRRFVAGNWKMYGSATSGAAMVGRLAAVLADLAGAPVDVVVCPPFTALAEIGRAAAGTVVGLGAQNLHWEDAGAYTGEISGPMLKELGCGYVIVGHSERRQHFGETDETVRKRLAAAARHSLRPILCVGETWEERRAARTYRRVGSQLRTALAGPPAGGAPTGGGEVSRESCPAGLVVAYEPVWAIGTGRAAAGADAQEVAAFIRRTVAELFGPEAASRVRVLYGGSVKPENIGEFSDQPDIDGALVGGASLDAAAFEAIVRRVVG